MQFKRVAATAIGALLAGATIAMPVLGATDLSNFPAPFVDGGKANFVIVVGSGGEAAGLASDIAGAIDIAARMGGESYTASTGGTATVSGGDSKEVPLGVALDAASGFDRTVWKNNKIPGLFKGKVDFKAKSYNAHEEIQLTEGTLLPAITGVTGSNGLYQEAGNKVGFVQNAKYSIKYVYTVDTDSSFNYGAMTTNDPLNLKVLGKDFKIVANASTTSIDVELGQELVLKVGDTATVDGKTIEVTSIGQSSVAVKVGTESKFLSAGATQTVGGLKVTVPSSGILYTQEAESRQVQIRVGSETLATIKDGDPMKQFGEPDDSTTAKWLWTLSMAGNGQTISIGAKFNQQYDSASEPIAFVGQSYDFPNSFGGVLLDSLIETNFREYNMAFDTIDASTSDAGGGASNMKVFIFTAVGATNEGFTLLDGSANVDSHIAYVNNTGRVFYKDANGKIQLADSTSNITVSYGDIAGTNGIVIVATNFNNTMSWGTMDGFTVDRFWVKLPEHFSGAGAKNLTLATGSSMTASPQRLGATSATKEADEVIYDGVAFGTRKYDVLTHLGVQILNPESNGNADKIIMKVPASKQRAKVVIKGPTTTVSGGSGTATKLVSPIKTAVAKVDTEVSDASALKEHLILVGGPCVNRLTAQALKLDFPACGEKSGIKAGEGFVKFVADAFKSGQNALLVYGYEKDNTRAAANAVQNFDAKGFTGTSYMA